MLARIYEKVIDGPVALGYIVDGTEVHDNLIRSDRLAGHWAGDLWNTRLWNNIVVTTKPAITGDYESRNAFVNERDAWETEHLSEGKMSPP